MPDEDDTKKTLETLGAGPAAKELYVDLMKPAAQELSKNVLAVAKIITAALTPLHAMVWGFERVREWLFPALTTRLASVAPEDIQPPEQYIAGQILMQLPFCADQERLRELYANLLAASMTRGRAAGVHPSFVHVIQQLTPDEALVLRHIHRTQAPGKGFNLQDEYTDRGIKGSESVSMQFRGLCERAGVADCSMSEAFLENLLRLRILRESQWSEGKYHPPSRFDEDEASVENRSGTVIELGAFGERFLAACM